MLTLILIVLAVLFLVLGFLHVIGLLFGIGLAVACLLVAFILDHRGIAGRF